MKTTFKFDKLIRDKAHQKMLEAGVEMNLKKLSEEETLSYYKKKIVEEAEEVRDANTTEELIEEMADCLEVIRSMAKFIGTDFDEIENIRKVKKEHKGSFDNHIIVEDVSLERKGIFTKFYDYYIGNPQKYPVVEKIK